MPAPSGTGEIAPARWRARVLLTSRSANRVITSGSKYLRRINQDIAWQCRASYSHVSSPPAQGGTRHERDKIRVGVAPPRIPNARTGAVHRAGDAARAHRRLPHP